MANIKSFCSKNTLVLVVVVMFIFCSIYNSTFLTAFNINGMLVQIAYMGFLAIGMAFVILTGGIDLSVGALAGLSTVILTLALKDMNTGNDAITILLAVIMSVGITSALGFASGFLITKLKLPPLIATLSISWIAIGIGQSLLKGSPLALAITSYKKIIGYSITDWIPVSFVAVIVVLIIMVYILKNFHWGRKFYAVGSNKYAAFISGTKTNKVVRTAYVISGLFAGIAGLLIASYIGSGYATAAKNYELYTIAAVVMGGISLTGGEGKIYLAIFGVIILRLLNKLVVFTGLSSISGFIEGIIVGSILIAVLLINNMRKEGSK